MRRLLFFPLFVGTFWFAYSITDHGRPRDAYHTVCELSAQHFYKDDEAFRLWLDRCRRAARALPRSVTADEVVSRLQTQMDELAVSHFAVYAPAEDRKLWTGESVHTGIRSRYVDGHLIIHRVIEGSAAADVGLRPGDEITKLPDVDEVSPAGASFRRGRYVIRRGGRDLNFDLVPRSLVIDGAPRIEDLESGLKLLTIPSFRAEYFRGGALERVTRALASSRGIVVDVRENSGGNFAAMLRALSFFDCGSRTIGHLRQARNRGGEVGTLVNELSDTVQIRQLERARELALTTPPGYGCFSGPTVTLTAAETSSVAEIFADAMAERASATVRSKVWGWRTAGDVVLAIWYPLPALGLNYSVSIPQASFVDLKGRDLEGHGVRPSRELFYDLASSRAGEDSWVNAAVRELKSTR